MAKSSRTLYEQLRESSESETIGADTTPSWLRWCVIVLAIVVLTLLLPGAGAEEAKGVYNNTLLGTVWSQETVFADYSFPVPKSPIHLAKQRDSARLLSPLAFTADTAEAINKSDAKHTQPIVNVDRDSIKAAFVLLIEHSGNERLVPSSMVRTRDEAGGMAPTYLFDAVETERLRNEAAASVSTTLEIVRKGDRIVRKGQRLDDETIARLSGYRNAEHLRANVGFNVFAFVGSLVHAAIIMAFVVLYLYFLRPVSYQNIGQLITLVSLPIVSALCGWLSVRLNPSLPIEYAIVVPALSMIITILYEERTALVITMAMSIAAGASRGDDYSLMIVLLVGGIMGIYSARNIHSRTQIFTSIVAIFIGLVMAVLAIELERSAPVEWVWPKIVMATANAVLSPLITFAIIMVFERVFNVATDLRLEEFNTLNHPLLKSLNERAPGTYQHTLAVARLSEAAAQAIGANVLLTRVGAYFHDIGKIEKSEYFVENQIGIDNKHDRLSPKKSAAIIRQHVQDGLELAREYKLPERIWKFIPMHHGTILISHFYTIALEEAASTNAVVDEQDFRYAGPQPDSRETAIVMLADAAEALSRLVDTSQRDAIASAVERIIVDRITDGQLKNTPLTMRDLDAIKDAFVKNLHGTAHQRVRYKGGSSSAS